MLRICKSYLKHLLGVGTQGDFAADCVSRVESIVNYSVPMTYLIKIMRYILCKMKKNNPKPKQKRKTQYRLKSDLCFNNI